MSFECITYICYIKIDKINNWLTKAVIFIHFMYMYLLKGSVLLIIITMERYETWK